MKIVSEEMSELYIKVRGQKNYGNPINLTGVIFATEELEYHYQNYIDLHPHGGVNTLGIDGSIVWGRSKGKKVLFEILAYVSVVGRMYYWIKENHSQAHFEKNCPTMNMLTTVRHKYAAHRSLDKAEKHDTPKAKIAHASTASGWIYNDEGYIVMHFFDTDKTNTEEILQGNIDLMIEHPKVMQELKFAFETSINNTV